MSDAWAASWGTSWAESWGAGGVPPVVTPIDMHDGFTAADVDAWRKRKKRRRPDVQEREDVLERAFAAAWAELSGERQSAPDEPLAAPDAMPEPAEVLAAPANWPSLVPLAMELVEIARLLAALERREDEEAAVMLLLS